MLKISIIRIGILLLAGVGTCVGLADDDEHESEHHSGKSRRNVAAVPDPTYRAECASCHMLYPPGLLPSQSWKAIMGGLKNHFGENASLDDMTANKLTAFLTEHAADRAPERRSQKIARSIGAASPLRFSDTEYFRRQHHEVSGAVWKRKSVGSPANCVACHSRAEAGVFSEDEIRIPQ